MYITLQSSTCFEQYYAHPQEVKIVLLQHLVLPLGRSQRVTIPDAVTMQFGPPEDEHSIARNMLRHLMFNIYYGIKKLCIKLVIQTCFEHAYCSSSGRSTLYIQQLVCVMLKIKECLKLSAYIYIYLNNFKHSIIYTIVVKKRKIFSCQ
jgi:hypothetical protein